MREYSHPNDRVKEHSLAALNKSECSADAEEFGVAAEGERASILQPPPRPPFPLPVAEVVEGVTDEPEVEELDVAELEEGRCCWC